MHLKLFQKQDLARASLHDGLILSWDTGLGKTWALFLWALLKLGYHWDVVDGERRCIPHGPVLIIAPGDLHQQIAEEAWTHFRIRIQLLDGQATFERLIRTGDNVLANLTEDGRPVVPPGFYVTSYTQLATNGVAKLPDADDWDPRALQQWLCLPWGEHQDRVIRSGRYWPDRPKVFDCVTEAFAWREGFFADHYAVLGVGPDDSLKEVERRYNWERDQLQFIRDPNARNARAAALEEAWGILSQLAAVKPTVGGTRFSDLNDRQQDFTIRFACKHNLVEFAQGLGEVRGFPVGPPSLSNPSDPSDKSDPPTNPQRFIKCVFSPSLADLCWNAFEVVEIDEGVRMKGTDTLIGQGVRAMQPRFRMVLTATPVKNRLHDIFWLAWWAAGAHPEATARFPYPGTAAAKEEFAATFMVSERNLTKEAKNELEGKSAPRRKLTAEVCNIHRLWKLLGPLVLRRRKQDAGEDIVPRIRQVLRAEMGTQQRMVYQYHLECRYTDRNGAPAIGAQLQALRVAAADPTSPLLEAQYGTPRAACACRGKDKACPLCHGRGEYALPPRSGNPFTPKMATVLRLIEEILVRQEQVVVFSAFHDPLDRLAHWLGRAGVRHSLLDGRVAQKARGREAARFKAGRQSVASVPVLLAGVECMAEGHSFHRCNNVILLAYSWAYDKFKQALDRVHRLTSEKPVNIYVVLCQGSIDRKLESLVQEKSDAAELVLDGQLLGERVDEVNLAELLQVARREFNTKDRTIDEAVLERSWPGLLDQLTAAMGAWSPEIPRPSILDPAIPCVQTSAATYREALDFVNPDFMNQPIHPRNSAKSAKSAEEEIERAEPTVVPAGLLSGGWRERMLARAVLLAEVQAPDLWNSL